ncbi:MAG: SAM-dependent methyltransferase [Leptospira sp.]|nr:SAM-dependent methyltransferase [Leptospira sp.]
MNQDSNTIETSSGSGGLEMFRNRLKKNKKEISKWARKNNISCYRIYDKDVPQVPVAIDDYEGDFVLQYFRGPYDESDIIMDSRIRSIEDIILEVFEIKPNKLFTKLREKKKGSSQYNKLSKSYTTKIVTEGFAKFKINLTDYLDVGLFLDHRPLREKVSLLAADKSILNLFSYTGAFTIQSCLAGAKFTTSVDSSPVYMDWTLENLKLNHLSLETNELVCSDIFDWIEAMKTKKKRNKYDIIILDPPTFSNNKKKEKIFDLQMEQTFLIDSLMKDFLDDDGILFFSTNFRKFKLSEEISTEYNCFEFSEQTVPYDFRDKKIHKTWQIEFKDKVK